LRNEGDRTELARRVKVSGLDHVSVTCGDLDASIAFYADVLGLEVAARGESNDREIALMMGLDRVRIRWADVDLGDGTTLELVQFLDPTGSPVSKSLWDPGAAHIGLQVDDIDATHARLREAQVRVVSKPVRLTEQGSWYGAKVLYAVDPDGTWIELVERPEAVAVLHETDDQEIRVDVHERP
jgi:catechol 2,3-dioxygenase-like lactoylglutathione lyase family enzyme